MTEVEVEDEEDDDPVLAKVKVWPFFELSCGVLEAFFQPSWQAYSYEVSKNTEQSNPPLEQPSQSNDAAEIAGAAAANSAKVGNWFVWPLG